MKLKRVENGHYTTQDGRYTIKSRAHSRNHRTPRGWVTRWSRDWVVRGPNLKSRMNVPVEYRIAETLPEARRMIAETVN